MLESWAVVVSIFSIGAICGGWYVGRRYRDWPTAQQAKWLARIYQYKAEDYKSLCKDCVAWAENLSVLANSIHASEPSESSGKIIKELDSWIATLNERSSGRQFTPQCDVRVKDDSAS